MRRSLRGIKRTAAEAGTEFSIILPNKLDSWAKVSENLRKIVQGEVRDVEGFERVYTSIEAYRPKIAEPKFAGLRLVLRDGRHVSERHFLDTLLPWIASKALEVESLFRDQNYQLPVRSPHTPSYPPLILFTHKT